MMDNDKDQEDRDRKDGLKGVLAVAQPQPAVGSPMSRSRKLRDPPPRNPIQDGVVGSPPSERKRARREEEGADGDGVKVKVNPRANGDTQEGADGLDKSSLLNKQGKVQLLKLKVEGVKRGKGPSPSSSTAGDNAPPGSKNESSELFPMEEEAHPCLLNEVILDVVFKHIINQPRSRRSAVAKDVQSIRLVCKTWNDSVTRAYRRRPVAKLRAYDEGHWTRLSDFMDMLKSCKLIPVQKFSFWNNVFRAENLDLFEDFFRICGPQVVSLELHINHDGANKLIRSLTALPGLNLPKLETLKIQTSYYACGVRKPPGIVTLVEFILTGARALREFDLSYPPCHGRTHAKPQVAVMTQLVQTIGTRSPRTLKQLKLCLQVTEMTFDNLVEAGLALEGFEYGDASKLGRRTLYKFLESQSPTLNALRIYASYRWRPNRDPTIPRTDIPLELPLLGQLVELELSNVIVSRDNGAQFKLGQTFPKLVGLELGRMNNQTQTAFRALLVSASKPPQSLKVLHLPVFPRASLAPIVQIVAPSFPSITELHMELHKGTRETMEGVFRHLDRLQSLNIWIHERNRNAHWLESILSGIPVGEFRSRIVGRAFGTVNLTKYQEQPSILNLTALRKLVVKLNDTTWGTTFFSDFSAHFLFLGMEELRELELPIAEVKFSRRYLELLKDKLFLVDLNDSGSESFAQ